MAFVRQSSTLTLEAPEGRCSAVLQSVGLASSPLGGPALPIH